MAKLTREFQRRARREGTENCALCSGILNTDENERGVVQFVDGWFWVCSSCKAKVGNLFDASQSDNYAEAWYIPYHKRSRKRSQTWLKEEYQIEIQLDSK